MGSGGGGSSQPTFTPVPQQAPTQSVTSTTNTGPPPWLQQIAQNQFMPALQQAVFGSTTGSTVNPYPQGLNVQVAPFTDAQKQALNTGIGATPAAQELANIGAGTQGMYASGGMMGPNPYLNAYYGQAAGQDVNQYLYGTQPSLAAQFQQAGAFNSSGYNEALGQAGYGLGQSLATLGANIYEPAYQFESGQALNAAQNMPSAISALYAPSRALYGFGSTEQQQAQNELNVATQNVGQQVNWPFAMLSQFGAGMGQAGMGASTSTSTAPLIPQTYVQPPSSTGGGK